MWHIDELKGEIKHLVVLILKFNLALQSFAQVKSDKIIYTEFGKNSIQ